MRKKVLGTIYKLIVTDPNIHQIRELNLLGRCPGLWYMLAAVQAHENKHLEHCLPALDFSIPMIVSNFPSLSVPFTGQSEAAAIAQIKALPAWSSAKVQARDLWWASVRYFCSNDHDPGGVCETAAHGVVDPMISTICTYATAHAWNGCCKCQH
jgi:hypothetical protein